MPAPWYRTLWVLQRWRKSPLRVDSSPTRSWRSLSWGSRPALVRRIATQVSAAPSSRGRSRGRRRGRVGYLLKDRVASLDVLVDALRTITAGGTVLDPEVVAQLLVARRADPLGGAHAAGARCAPTDGRGPQQ